MRASREEEFRAYVVEARPRLVRTATLLAGDAHLAEDVVQTTLTRLFLAWPRIRRADGPDAYARKVLVNALIDERRRPFWRRETARAEVPDTAHGPVIEPAFDELQTALAELPPGMRAAVVFRYVHELSVAETADALSCSEGNVKSQTARGLERLRSALSGHDPHDSPAAPPVPPPGPAADRSQPLSQYASTVGTNPRSTT